MTESGTPLLGPEELAALRAIGVERFFDTGERLVSIGSASTEVFYLLAGLVKIVVLAPSGTESVFAHRTPGEFIGEMSTLNDEPRSADVVAVEPTTTIMVSAADFIRYAERHPAVLLSLLRMLSQRLNEMTRRSVLGSQSVKARLAQRLTDLGMQVGSDSAAGPATGHDIVVSITQSDLAKWVDASREWTSKALADLRELGCIATHRGKVIITDLEGLRNAGIED